MNKNSERRLHHDRSEHVTFMLHNICIYWNLFHAYHHKYQLNEWIVYAVPMLQLLFSLPLSLSLSALFFSFLDMFLLLLMVFFSYIYIWNMYGFSCSIIAKTSYNDFVWFVVFIVCKCRWICNSNDCTEDERKCCIHCITSSKLTVFIFN